MVRECEAAARLAALEQDARQQATRQWRRALTSVVGALLASTALVLLGGCAQAVGLVP